MVEYEVKNKNFLITGGASGLGAKYVEAFLGLGAKNIAILDVAKEAGNALVDEYDISNPGKVVFIECDVSKEHDITKGFEEAVLRFNYIDVIINNAGVMIDSPEAWRVACDVNWKGVVSLTMKGINHMSKDVGGIGGTIINVSSALALKKFPFLPIYSGSKLAVLHFTQNISMDPFFERTGIRMLTICFGATDTSLLQGLDKRSYSTEMGNLFMEIAANSKKFQSVLSAVSAFIKMYKTGHHGSIWYSADDKPGRDITAYINAAFESFEQNILDI